MNKDLPKWAVSLIGKKPRQLATVQAKDAEAAIAAVIKDLNITDPERIKRVAARPA